VKKCRFFGILEGLSAAPCERQTAGDAGYIVSVYVQISLSVTKVLIRKRF